METTELLEIIGRDEDSKHQFKANVTNEISLAQEMVAFSNSGGGTIFIGVSDDGTFAGLTRKDMGRLNQLVFNAASQQVRSPINPQTENIDTPNGLLCGLSCRTASVSLIWTRMALSGSKVPETNVRQRPEKRFSASIKAPD